MEYAYLLAMIVAAFIGMLIGRYQADGSWIVSGKQRPEWRTAHYARGEFFYVIPESEFVSEWRQIEVPTPSPRGVNTSTMHDD